MIKQSLFVGAGLLACISVGAQAEIIVGGPASNPAPRTATLGNGNFEADSGSPLPYTSVTNWFNVSGADTINFGQTGGMGGSPEANSQGAFLFQQRISANSLGHAVTGAGEVFDIDFYGNRFGGGYNDDESFLVYLFTSTTGVDADTVEGDITILDTTSFDVLSGWENYTQDGIYTTSAADIGQTVYLGMSVSNDTGNDVFPRVDVITWEVTVPEPASLALVGVGALAMLGRGRQQA